MNKFLAFALALVLVPMPGIEAAPPSGAAATVAPGTFTVERLMALIPADVKLKKGGRWDPVAIAIATQAMRAKAMQQPAEVVVKVGLLEPHPFNGHAIHLRSKTVSVIVNGTSIPVEGFIFFDADKLAGLGGVRVGDTVKVSGVINKADIEIKGNDASVIYELLKAEIVAGVKK